MEFTWRSDKAARNLRDHGVSFDVAANVFNDPHVLHVEDCDIEGETRFHAIGFANEHLLAVVVYFEPNEETYHIISARKAEAFEEKIYAAQF